MGSAVGVPFAEATDGAICCSVTIFTMASHRESLRKFVISVFPVKEFKEKLQERRPFCQVWTQKLFQAPLAGESAKAQTGTTQEINLPEFLLFPVFLRGNAGDAGCTPIIEAAAIPQTRKRLG